ncbi:nucleotide pyrophosphohydrolase, partial [Geodermatophilus sp. SYSU D00766]
MIALQDRLREFAEVRQWGRFHTLKNLAMALAGEVGEVITELQWLTEEKSSALIDEGDRRDRVMDEVADVAFYLLRSATCWPSTCSRRSLVASGRTSYACRWTGSPAAPSDRARPAGSPYSELAGRVPDVVDRRARSTACVRPARVGSSP